MYRREPFEVSRLVASGSTKTYQATGVTVYGQLDAAGAEFVGIADGAFGKTYALTTPQVELDIRIGDRMTGGGKQYEVKGVQVSTRLVPNTVLQLVEAQA